MSEQKYISHISDTCFIKRYDQESMKESLGGNLGTSYKSVNQFQKAKNKWKSELKDLQKQKK